MPDDVTLGGSAESEQADRAFRRKALYHSWLCSGAGFAFLGRRGAALLTYIAVVGLLPVVTWVALRPSPASAWAALGVFTAASVLSVAEQFVWKWATPRPAGPGFLVGGLPVASVLFWAALAATLAVFF
jgi:hypothetical protein